MNDEIKKIAKAGYASKGIVYFITGSLAFGAAYGLGSEQEGKLGVLKFLQEQPFGNVLLGIVGLGLLCYSFWRFYQSTIDPEDIGSNKKALGKRIGFFFSGLVYLGLGIYSIYQIVGKSDGGGNNTGSVIPTDYMSYIFYAVAIGLGIKAIFQFVKVYKGTFLKKFHLKTMTNAKARSTIKWLGYTGMASRGIVVGLISYFFFRAANTASQAEIKGTSDAFSFLRRNSEGPWLMGIVALGLIAFGLYMLIMAKYRKFDD